MTLPLARRAAGRIPRRDLVAGYGDGLRLQVSLAEADRPGAALVDLLQTTARLRMHVWRDAGPLDAGRDYGLGWRGPVLSSSTARATADHPFYAEIALSVIEPAMAANMRFGWSLQCVAGGDAVSLCWGALHLAPYLGMPSQHLVADSGDHVTADTGEHLVVE